MVSRGNYAKIAALFRLVNYCNLRRRLVFLLYSQCLLVKATISHFCWLLSGFISNHLISVKMFEISMFYLLQDDYIYTRHIYIYTRHIYMYIYICIYIICIWLYRGLKPSQMVIESRSSGLFSRSWYVMMIHDNDGT